MAANTVKASQKKKYVMQINSFMNALPKTGEYECSSKGRIMESNFWKSHVRFDLIWFDFNCNVYVRAQGPVLSCREIFECPPPFLLLIFRTRYIIVIFCRSPHNRYVAYMHKKYMYRFVFSSTRDRRKMGLIQAKLFPCWTFENVKKKVTLMSLFPKKRSSACVKLTIWDT